MGNQLMSIDADGFANSCTWTFSQYGVPQKCTRADVERVPRYKYDPQHRYSVEHGPCIRRKFWC